MGGPSARGATCDVDEVVRTIATVAGPSAPLHAPEFSGNEWRYVKDCLDTGWVSSVGAYVTRFEQEVAAFVGVDHAVATVNGTTALHAALLVAGVEPGDEVIVPALTFVATANAVAHAGAVPHFADSEQTTLGLDPERLDAHLRAIAMPGPDGCRNRSTGRRIRAVVCVHTFGHPAAVDRLAEVCDHFGLDLIEDAAESLGSYRGGRHTGTVGRLAILSFNGNKVITTGGGGMVLTDDPELAAAAKHLTTTAKRPHRWAFEHDQVGYNYRMPNLNAALGCAQLEQLPGFLERKRALAAAYEAAFAPVAGVRFFTEPPGCRSNYWLNLLLLDRPGSATRDAILEATNTAGLTTRPAWTPMHLLPMYRGNPRMDLPVAEDLHRRLVNVPSSPGLGSGSA